MKNAARIIELESELAGNTTFLSSRREQKLEDALWMMMQAYVIGKDQSEKARREAVRTSALILKGGKR